MDTVNLITLFVHGQKVGTFDLDSYHKNHVLMGRGTYHGEEGTARNDICVDQSYSFVSRAQCSFVFENGIWNIIDDNSRNGIFFANERIHRRELLHNDQIQIGHEAGKRLILLFTSHAKKDQHEEKSGYALKPQGSFVIGRSNDCDIVIDHPMISRRHCVITCQNGKYYVQDKSINGVILNGQPLRKVAMLQPKDRISIGNISFVFQNNRLYSKELKGGVSVKVEHLSKKVGKGEKSKSILKDVSFTISPNEFVAIVGGSGAGKTTLLTCMSGLSEFTDGNVFIGGESIQDNKSSLGRLMGYVPQQDIVHESLSLERMLYHSAHLRMPIDTSEEEIRKKIDEVLRIVELEEHRKTLISKLSGGQRKRASIAVELLGSPKLFFLDEPSSGLDPGTERHLMQMLKKLAESGKTVVMVTHNVQNVDLCDRIICMGKGGLLCYSGSPKNSLSFFGAESMTDIYNTLNENAPLAAKRFASQSGASERKIINVRAGKAAKPARPGFLELNRQFLVMTLRYAEILKNSIGRLALLLTMPILLSFLVCIAYQADGNLLSTLGIYIHRVSYPFLSQTDTKSILFAFACAAFWVGIFNSIQEISRERDIYEREKFAGVDDTQYVFSKFFILSLLCFVQAVLMSLVFNVLTNTTAIDRGDIRSAVHLEMPLNGLVFTDGGLWLEMFLTSFLTVMAAMCLGLVISSLVSNEMAMVICPICLLPQILFSGIASSLTGITETVSKFVTCRWSCIAYYASVDINSFYDSYSFSATDEAWSKSDGVTEAAYDASMTYIAGLNPVLSAWTVLGLMCVVCVIAAILVLKFRKPRSR